MRVTIEDLCANRNLIIRWGYEICVWKRGGWNAYKWMGWPYIDVDSGHISTHEGMIADEVGREESSILIVSVVSMNWECRHYPRVRRQGGC